MLELLLPPLWAICSLNISAWVFFPYSMKPKYSGGSVQHCCHFNSPTCLKPNSLIMDKHSSRHPNNTTSYFIVNQRCAVWIKQSRQAIAA